jgi:O-antigen/teichoic acid export membrane protein
MFSKVQGKLGSDRLLGSLLRGSGTVLLIQVLGRGIGYFDQIVLARWMGVDEYGVYVYIVAWATLVTLIPQMGQRDAVVRFIPEFKVNNQAGELKGVVQGSLALVCSLSVGLSAIATGVAVVLYSRGQIDHLQAALLGIWLMPLIALVELSTSILQGFRLFIAAYAPITLVRPVLVLLGAIGLYLWQPRGQHLTSTTALAVTLVSFSVILLGMVWIIRAQLRSAAQNTPAIYEIRKLLRVSLPLLLAAGFGTLLLQSDVVMIGLLRGPREVGLYNAAVRTVAIVGFILTSVSAAAAPMISATFAEGNLAKLQGLIRRGNQLTMLPSLVIVVAVVALSGPLLRNFGPEFEVMQWVLIVLAMGQLIKATCGPIGLLLDMTGHQDDSARVRGTAASLNIGLNLLGIQMLGPLGAALATAIAISFERVFIDFFVVKRLGIACSWLSPINRRLLALGRPR